MAFVTQKSGDNPFKELDDGMFEAEITGWQRVDNRFKGQLFNPNQPESENNRKNNYEFQYEVDLKLFPEGGEPVEGKVWANPTLGEKSKLRRLVKAAGAWEADPATGQEGFDDEASNMVGRKLRVLVQEGGIPTSGFLTA